jgi:hypothetical protein
MLLSKATLAAPPIHKERKDLERRCYLFPRNPTEHENANLRLPRDTSAVTTPVQYTSIAVADRGFY